MLLTKSSKIKVFQQGSSSCVHIMTIIAFILSFKYGFDRIGVNISIINNNNILSEQYSNWNPCSSLEYFKCTNETFKCEFY